MHLAKTWYEHCSYTVQELANDIHQNRHIFFFSNHKIQHLIFMNTLLSSKKIDFKTSSNEYEVFVFKSLKL